jgi:hypothetical protein
MTSSGTNPGGASTATTVTGAATKAATRLTAQGAAKPGGMRILKRINKALASLKIAVFVIIAIAALTAWGTFVEAEYDAAAAQKLIYHSPWMYGVFLLLMINLTAVMIDRWPWQARHTGFILAHIGIIILLLGSIVTRYWGIDGSITLGMGESSRHVVVGQTDLAIYTSPDGSRFAKYFDREVDFFLRPPSESKPIEVNLPNGLLKISEYYPYSIRQQKVVEASGERVGSGVRFQLQNANVNMSDWLVQAGPGRNAVKDLGPAQVILTSGAEEWRPDGRNTILLRAKSDSAELKYEIHSARDPERVIRGVAKAGDSIETGWMGLVLRILKFLPGAREEISFIPSERPTPLTIPAIRVDYNGATHWVALNSMLKLFSNDSVFILTYANRRLDMGFGMKLEKFDIGRYQGTMRAASYQSLVTVPGIPPHLISMNEPLKHNGYTFYQASFQEDENGVPVASVLSVNWDPGRWIKYLGSLLIVLGTIHLFYFKRKTAKASAAAADLNVGLPAT